MAAFAKSCAARIGRVLINAQIVAGSALTLRLRHHWYWYFWLGLSKKQRLTELGCTTDAGGGCGGLSQRGTLT
jgi:hypothetical protein